MAIVSKSIFQKEARSTSGLLRIGETYQTSVYRSKSKGLVALDADSQLYLVTVRPNDVLWLVGVLAAPVHSENGWQAAINKVPITDITHLVSQIRFASDKGINRTPGRLAMSLQSPRTLGEADLSLLRECLNPPAAAMETTPVPKPEASTPPTLLDNTEQEMTSLLSLWATYRDEAVAEVIARYGKAHESKRASKLRNSKPSQEDWIIEVEKLNVVDRGALLVSLPNTTSANVRARVESLESWGCDPRIATALHQIVNDLPWISSGTRNVWTQIFKRLIAIGDPRSIQLAQTFDPASIRSSWAGPGEFMSSRLKKVAEKIAKEAPPSRLPPDSVAVVATLRKSLPVEIHSQSQSQQLEHVLAHPDDLDARLVLADFLLEVEDPRGELIILQSLDKPNRSQKKQIRTILKENHDHLLGDLAPILLKKGLEFRNGFVHCCELKGNVPKSRFQKAETSPLLATIEICSGPIEFIVLPGLCSLRDVTVHYFNGETDLDLISQSKTTLPFQKLSIPGRDDMSKLGKATNLPDLEELSVQCPGNDPMRSLMQSGLVNQLRSLRMHQPNMEAFLEGAKAMTQAGPASVSAFWDDEWTRLHVEFFLDRENNEIVRARLHMRVPPSDTGTFRELSRIVKDICNRIRTMRLESLAILTWDSDVYPDWGEFPFPVTWSRK